MTTAPALKPKDGFDWGRVKWGAPDEPVSEECSYCCTAIPEDSVPLMLFDQRSWGAVFCDACMVTWWGFSPRVPAPDEDDDGFGE
jgi:hypothetical protein